MAPPKRDTGNRTNKMVCRICLGNHPLRSCKSFLKEDYHERMHLVKLYKYCAGCLSHDHTWRTCESTGGCRKCGDTHHTLLHKPVVRHQSSGQSYRRAKQVKRLQQESRTSNRQKRKGSNQSRVSANRRFSSDDKYPNRHKRTGPSQSLVCNEEPSSSRAVVPANRQNYSAPQKTRLLKTISKPSNMPIPLCQINQMIMIKPTAMIKIVAQERYIMVRAVIDPSLEYSIISDQIVERIGANTIKVGQKRRCLITIRGSFGMSTTVETYTVVHKRHNIITPSKTIDNAILEEFAGLQLADNQFHVAAPAQVTLGADVYPKIIRNGVAGGSFGKPLAQFSIFGFIISGAVSN